MQLEQSSFSVPLKCEDHLDKGEPRPSRVTTDNGIFTFIKQNNNQENSVLADLQLSTPSKVVLNTTTRHFMLLSSLTGVCMLSHV